jgi:hypothetical protein
MNMRTMPVSVLDFGPGRGNSTGDRLLKGANLDGKTAIDVLIFTDSRGACLDDMDAGWASLLFNFLKSAGLSTLLVVRPRDCTVFLTLINFLRINGLKCDHLVAQVGLVDLTPKKTDVVADIMTQRSVFFGTMEFDTEKLSAYRLASGERENLYSVRFDSAAFKGAIADCLGRHCRRVTLVGALEVTADLKIKRKRPPEFFAKLKESNRFLAGIQKIGRNIGYIKPPDGSFYGPNTFSFDGVHYNACGHMSTYNRALKAVLDARASVLKKGNAE